MIESVQLSVIIVSYNVKYFLEQCLYSVEAACKNINAEILVIDNASFDNTIEYLQPKFQAIKFIKNDLNEGFAKANNKALQFAQGKYILYLNPDTIVTEDTFLRCLQFLDEHINAGAVGIKMVDGSGNFLPESKRDVPSVLNSFFKMSGIALLFPRSAFFNRYALGNLDENKPHEVDVLPGAFFMTRRNILIALNGFDEIFFMYGEDIDLSYRIQKSGYKNYYLGNNAIVHFKGESTQKDKPEYIKNFYQAMTIFVQKHYRKQLAFLLKITITLSKAIASLKQNLSANASVDGLGKKEKKDLGFVLVGDNTDTQSAENILSKYNYSLKKISALQQLNQTVLVETNTAIVFCTGKLSYAETINFIQKNKNKYSYFWHKANSESVVGSSCSNTTGEIYTIN